MAGPVTKERAQEIVDELRGTCRGLYEVLNEGENQDDETLTEAIDAELFCCSCCDWWYDLDELAEGSDDTCSDCY